MKGYTTPVDRFGRRWPELKLPNHRVWLCDECGQPDIRRHKPCTHSKLSQTVVKSLGGKF